jgi:23S rRNA (cytidine1920-2'-O)/16S rRNA (cytidine1409-2'-O)-methyltransferase
MSMNSFHRRKSRAIPPVVSPPAPVAVTTTPAHLPAKAKKGLLRVDVLLVERGLASSRTAAQRLIESGRVSSATGPVHKPSELFASSAALTITADESDRYVSRGGLKLAGALQAAGLVVTGWTCLDVGQSTGGFTDCLLQAGAARVVGVDVGHSQLHPQLQGDPRIVSLEGINCRNLEAKDLGAAFPASTDPATGQSGGFDLIVADVSFISLALILPQLPALLSATGQLMLLVKPQFELGPSALGKGGIVRDPARYVEVEARFRQLAAALNLHVAGWFDSPITGGDGNHEFFLWAHHANTRTVD